MKKISVIIPIYNAEKYITDCLDSVINQTYKNLEIILINDGSKDNSGKICDEYAQIDTRITVVHNENKGVSYSRNYGIKISTGEYILFIDSDDRIKTNYIYELINANKDNQYDLVICNMKNIYINSNNIIEENVSIETEKLSNILKNDYVYLQELLPYPFLKLYKAEIIKKNNIYFPEHICAGEDQIFNFQYYRFVKSYKFINKVLHYYFHRDNNSLSQIYNEKTLKMSLEKLEKEKNFFELLGIKDKEIVFNTHVIDLIQCFVIMEGKHSYRRFKEVIVLLKEKLYKTNKYYNKKREIIIKLINNNIYFPIYCYYLFKYYKKKYI